MVVLLHLWRVNVVKTLGGFINIPLADLSHTNLRHKNPRQLFIYFFFWMKLEEQRNWIKRRIREKIIRPGVVAERMMIPREKDFPPCIKFIYIEKGFILAGSMPAIPSQNFIIVPGLQYTFWKECNKIRGLTTQQGRGGTSHCNKEK
jgi:hypothetical protein